MSSKLPLWMRWGYGLAGPIRMIRRAIDPRRHILVINLGSHGDTLLCTGAIVQMTRFFGESRLDVLVTKSSQSLVSTQPGVCKIWTIERNTFGDNGFRCRMNRLRLAFGLGSRTYAHVIALSAMPNDVTLGLLRGLNPRQSWQFTENKETSAANETKPVLNGEQPTVIHKIAVQPDRHELDDLLHFVKEIERESAPGEAVPLSAVGASMNLPTLADIQPGMHFIASDYPPIEAVIQAHSSSPQGNVFRLALCPGARFKQKDWGLEKFKALLDQISQPGIMDSYADGRSLEVVLIGGPEDRERFRALELYATQKTKLRVWSLMGELNPRQSILFLKQCQACIGNDTFGLHAAIVAGTPSVVIMGGGDYGRWIPWANTHKHRMVAKIMPCQGCRWQCTRSDYDCIQKITVDEVIRAWAKIIDPADRKTDEPSFREMKITP